jgi:hypothetical protein
MTQGYNDRVFVFFFLIPSGPERKQGLEDDLRTVYSSLFSLRPAGDEEEEDKDAVIVTLALATSLIRARSFFGERRVRQIQRTLQLGRGRSESYQRGG